MSFLRNNRSLLLVFYFLFIVSCSKSEEVVPIVPAPVGINLNHFNHLYEEINFKGEKVGIIHLYSNYPSYEFEGAANEGFTCVDDVARAIVVWSEYIKVYGSDAASLDKIKKLSLFVLDLQNENGYFNNFIGSDLSINTTYPTSVATLSWWSLRALWGLETAYPLLAQEPLVQQRINTAMSKLLTNIRRDLPLVEEKTTVVDGIEMPSWLLDRYAADQSALLIIGLVRNYERTSNVEDPLWIASLARGIMVSQKGDTDHYPYGAFMSYTNNWHAWGNDQAYALLIAGRALNNQLYIDSALREIEGFYPKLIRSGFAESFSIRAIGSNYEEIRRSKYPQIAYGIRPMVWAAAEAYRYSKNSSHSALATNLAAWLSGTNDAGIAIYNPGTGVCFDGIDGLGSVNKNSGAESTIESLLVLLEIEKLRKL